ncbi:hypothetical protein QBC40DRAFT_165665 [Triangularia verruculosa]|uniref:Uncharacterized protein n=1 Tax=Triangularia verruculosa TaxID=2587418 RepID=A0AAN6XP47_9PEZI|nr:hypothetical protein QBC40DRAFT_165665 [Triangularia verruculosa]
MGSFRDQRPPSLAPYHFPPPVPYFEVLGRPMDPQPAPLIHINGSPGVGKETVAELLTSIIGDDKSMLIDVRSLDFDSDTSAHHKHLLTPEHPRYFSFDVGMESVDSIADTRELSDTEYKSPDTDNLIRLLSKPFNSSRTAVLPAYAPDTVAGRAFIRSLEHAAQSSGRLFIPVTLECASPERIRRTLSLQRQCSYKIRRQSEPAVSTVGTEVVPQLVVAADSESGQRKLATSVHGGLSLDITSVNAFAVALQIVEHVNGCRQERDIGWCSSSSAATTPTGSMEGEKRWKGSR